MDAQARSIAASSHVLADLLDNAGSFFGPEVRYSIKAHLWPESCSFNYFQSYTTYFECLALFPTGQPAPM